MQLLKCKVPPSSLPSRVTSKSIRLLPHLSLSLPLTHTHTHTHKRLGLYAFYTFCPSPGTDGGNISAPKASVVLLGGASGLGGAPGGVGGGHVDFLSANNTVVRAHAGSTVTMPCVVEKESQFGMVSGRPGAGGRGRTDGRHKFPLHLTAEWPHASETADSAGRSSSSFHSYLHARLGQPSSYCARNINATLITLRKTQLEERH